jgi:hypothetical protein
MKTDPPADASGAAESPLSAEEQLVLAHIDGTRTVREIAELTGIDEARMEAIVSSLARRGVLGAGEDAPAEPEPPPAHVAEDEAVAEAPASEPGADDEQEAPEEDAAEEERNYRKTFEAKFRPLPPDARTALAQTATEGDLCALCLDPDPRVIAAVLTNATFGLAHARLIAFHHRTPAGLEPIAARGDLVRDGLVLRRLLRNPQLAAGTLRRLLSSRRLVDIYKAAIDRDLPDVARTTTRGLLRAKFAGPSQPEERAELLLTTEARALQLLSGCTFDSRTTQILCGRQVYTALFIQNVARFGASPPALLAHLAKLPFVKRNPGLKKALMQHPNLPGDVKRSM